MRFNLYRNCICFSLSFHKKYCNESDLHALIQRDTQLIQDKCLGTAEKRNSADTALQSLCLQFSRSKAILVEKNIFSTLFCIIQKVQYTFWPLIHHMGYGVFLFILFYFTLKMLFNVSTAHNCEKKLQFPALVLSFSHMLVQGNHNIYSKNGQVNINKYQKCICFSIETTFGKSDWVRQWHWQDIDYVQQSICN